jgi:hypothetical protein
MRRLRPLVALALLAASGLAAAAGAAPADCPAPADVQPTQLVGLWRAQFDGLAQGATLLLEPHPAYAGSLSGEVNRNGERAKLAADLEDGAFTLEESADGVHISATWLGDVVAGSCGGEIRGSWQAEGAKSARTFVLRRLQATPR